VAHLFGVADAETDRDAELIRRSESADRGRFKTRALFKGINPLLKASLLVAIQTLQPHLWGDIVYVAGIAIRGKSHLNRPTSLNYSAFARECG